MYIGRNLNWLAILTVTILAMIIGSVWYAPSLLGGTWAAALGWSTENLNPTVWHYVAQFVVYFIMATVIAIFLDKLNIVTLPLGLSAGFFFWLGFLVTSEASAVIWARWPVDAYFVDLGAGLIITLMMSGILAVWRKR